MTKDTCKPASFASRQSTSANGVSSALSACGTRSTRSARDASTCNTRHSITRGLCISTTRNSSDTSFARATSRSDDGIRTGRIRSDDGIRTGRARGTTRSTNSTNSTQSIASTAIPALIFFAQTILIQRGISLFKLRASIARAQIHLPKRINNRHKRAHIARKIHIRLMLAQGICQRVPPRAQRLHEPRLLITKTAAKDTIGTSQPRHSNPSSHIRCLRAHQPSTHIVAYQAAQMPAYFDARKLTNRKRQLSTIQAAKLAGKATAQITHHA